MANLKKAVKYGVEKKCVSKLKHLTGKSEEECKKVFKNCRRNFKRALKELEKE